jgi:glycosyltransferase involved in cell wall biosynthesis
MAFCGCTNASSRRRDDAPLCYTPLRHGGVTEAELAAGTTEVLAEQRVASAPIANAPRIAYVAYPSSLVLRSANAVQTYATVQALRAIAPDCRVLIPRFAFRASRFTDLGAIYLLRLPFNAGRHLIRSVVWSYAERTWFSFRLFGWLIHQRLRHAAPDVLYVRDVVCAAWLALLTPRLSGAAVIFEAHDLEAENRSANSGPVARWIARRMDRIALGRARGVVSLTETFVPIIGQYRTPCGSGTIAVIPDAYDDAIYTPQDRDAARIALGIPSDAFLVAYTGLTFAYHGVELLVDAFRLLTEPLPNAHLVLVGGRAGERASIADRVRDLGITDRVTIVAPRPVAEIPAYLAAADVLVIPDTVTKASASPLKLFEYAAMARPIVASDLPALREILPAATARYVTAASPRALADGLQWVAGHPTEAEGMAHRARAAVSAHTYRARAAAIVSFCATLADRRP